MSSNRRSERGPWGDPARLKRIKRHGVLNPSPGPCANCGTELDGWTAVEPGTRPARSTKADPNISICAYCGALHEYTGTPLRHRPLTGDELTLALADPAIRRARAAIIIARATEPEAGDG
jgi:hypothetical protein